MFCVGILVLNGRMPKFINFLKKMTWEKIVFVYVVVYGEMKDVRVFNGNLEILLKKRVSWKEIIVLCDIVLALEIYVRKWDWLIV